MHEKTTSRKTLFLLALTALGVVYGDIGTSPLYAIREIFFGNALTRYTHADVLGAISIVFWALTIIVALKYILFVLRADNDGEGGVFALLGLIQRLGDNAYVLLGIFLMFAAGLLFGDGVITPAISVLSAVEGLSVVTHTFSPYVVPLTVVILIGLFAVQSRGTAKMGLLFGPIMVVWFVAIALLGLSHIVTNPQILYAVNPVFALQFFLSHDPRTIFLVLGSVMLVVTGGEALYADLGHFGKLPIRLSWFAVTYPALILNYFGQGAYLLSGRPVVAGNLFYSLVPGPLVIPMVLLATMATVIASQALISGAFSLSRQAVGLGLLPYLSYYHTHEEHAGQIYVPFVNWTLLIGSVLFVFAFGSSARLAGAYGLAVSGVMFVTTLCMIVIARGYWKWSKLLSWAVFVPLLFVDGLFLVANSFKFLEGGFIPVGIAGLFALIFTTWAWGRRHIQYAYDHYPVTTIADVIAEKKKGHNFPKAVILMTSAHITSVHDNLPIIKQIFLDRYGALPLHTILLKIDRLREPTIRGSRYDVINLFSDATHGSVISVTVRFGFMEEPDVEAILDGIAKQKEVPLPPSHHEWLIHVLQPMIHVDPGVSVWTRMRAFLFMTIHRVAATPMDYFKLGKNEPLSVDYLPVYLS